MLDKDYICKQCFSYLYEKIYNTQCADVVLTSDRAAVSYRRFSEKTKDEGADFIWFYCLYQFGRYLDKIEANKLMIPGGRVVPAMIFGERAYEVFKSRRVEMDFITLNNPLITGYKVSKVEFASKKGIKELKPFVPKSLTKDPIKKIASRGENPYETCIDMTDLYNEKDPSCQICVDRIKCEKNRKILYNR